jgi:tetratricopeptide (TPR) repeat protein
LQAAVKINPQDSEALLLLGTAYLHLKKYDKAKRYLIKILELVPGDIDASNNLSLVYFNQKRYSEAISQLQKSLRIDSKNIDALTKLGYIYYKLGKFDDAIRTYRRLHKIKPQSGKIQERLALLYIKCKKYDEIIRFYCQINNRRHLNACLLTKVGLAYYYKGDFKKAGRRLKEAAKRDPGKAEPHYVLGLIAHKQAALDAAIREYKQAVKLRKNYPAAVNQLATAYEDKGEYHKALYYYQINLKLKPNDRKAKRDYDAVKSKAIDYYLRKGSKAYFRNDYNKALRYWGRVLKLAPHNANAKKFIKTAKKRLAAKVKLRNDRADAFYQKKLFRDAQQEWSEALKLNAEHKRARAGLGKINLHNQKQEERRIAKGPKRVNRSNRQAALKGFKGTLKTGSKKKASRQYVNSIPTGQKKRSEQSYRKGIELFSKDKLREAIACLEQALEVDSNNQGIKNLLYKARTRLRENVKALRSRGIELANAGRLPEAKEKFNLILELDPDNAEAREHLSKLNGSSVQIVVSKEKIKKLYYDGVSLYLDGKNKGAIKVWRKILLLDPENEEAKSSIVKAQMELKEMEKRGIGTE